MVTGGENTTLLVCRGILSPRSKFYGKGNFSTKTCHYSTSKSDRGVIILRRKVTGESIFGVKIPHYTGPVIY